MSGLPSLSEKLEKFLTLLRAEDDKLETLKPQIVNVLQDIVEIILQGVMLDGHLVMENLRLNTKERGQRFVNIDTDFTVNKSVKEKVIRLHLLLTVKESAINVPQNLDARRHITFFANSLFMNMPKAPKVRNVLSFRSFAASKLNDSRWDSDFEKLWKPPPNPGFLPCTKLTPNYTTKHIRLLFGQCETVPEPGNNPTSGKNGSFLGLLSAVSKFSYLSLSPSKNKAKARVVDDTNPEEIEITTPAFNEVNFERVERLIKGWCLFLPSYIYIYI
ncbi:hypothetical protein AHAS_Ahas09G0060000 [Arachis hypogaea]